MACSRRPARTISHSDSTSMTVLGDQPRSALRGVGSSIAHATTARLSRVLRRDPLLWVFGARAGEAFADNAKYLFLHVASQYPEIRPVWLSENPNVISILRTNGYEAYATYSPRGLDVSRRAGVTFLTHGFGDICQSCSGGALSVMLWHGTPLKHVSWDDDFVDRPLAVRAAARYAHRRFDVLTAATEATRDSFVSGFRIDPEVVVPTGYPRNDVFDRAIPGRWIGVDPAVRRRVCRLVGNGQVWLYLPTFRQQGSEAAVDSHLDFDALDAFLDARDAHLLIKAHPFERLSIPERSSRVHLLPAAMDVYPVLPLTDGLLTDYSSILFDYLLADRPLVFYPYDREQYEAERGFYYEYESVTPGPRAADFGELLDALDRRMNAGGDDPFARERTRLRERFCQTDTNRCERVCATVFDRLGGRWPSAVR